MKPRKSSKINSVSRGNVERECAQVMTLKQKEKNQDVVLYSIKN